MNDLVHDLLHYHFPELLLITIAVGLMVLLGWLPEA